MGAHDERAAEPRRRARRQRGGRRGRLTRSADFDRVYRRGRSHANRYLVVYAFPRVADNEEVDRDGGRLRLGVSVGRKVGGAAERNRVKRVLREAFRAVAADLPDNHDYVIVARPDAGSLAREQGEPGIEQALRDLIGAAGLGRDGA